MNRFTYSACALLITGGMFVSCDDDLLTGTPSWLGSSIYAELEERGNYTTILNLINDTEVSSINETTGQTENARTLSLTGSKTLFVANDEAFDAFFSNNTWGVGSYSELSAAQKKLLLNSAMLNNAYLIELMSSTSDGDDPTEGTTMRRTTAVTLYDSIPVLKAGDMPDNDFWASYRSQYPTGGDKGMTVFRDNTVTPMVHFLPAYMSNKSITDDDLTFLTNGECDDISESYVNGQRVTEQDITCQNGYIQVLENVMTPLTNMAELIRNTPSLSTFSAMLDRFCVPVYNSSLSSTVGDSAFVWRYLNSGFESESSYNAYLTHNNVSYDADDVLSYDPGWNQYRNGESQTPMNEDMAVIIAPTDDAFDAYFLDEGKALIDRYDSVENVPDHIIADMLNNFMKKSLTATVPSKFSSVMNTAQLEMGLDVSELDSCLMACNGVVYKSNKVYRVPEYQSVAFPASLNDDENYNSTCNIMRYMIDDLNYDAYLNSMESEFFFILPTDDALKNYIDPVDYHKNQKTITEFYYDSSSLSVKATRYNAVDDGNGGLTKGTEITNPWTNNSTESDYVENRLKDILENSIIVKDAGATTGNSEQVWVAKSGCPIIMKGNGTNIEITTPYHKELNEKYGLTTDVLTVRDRNGKEYGYYDMGNNPDGNGETFIIDSEPVMTASRSVPTLLKDLASEDSDFDEFYHMVMNCDLAQLLYNIMTNSSGTSSSARTISNDTTINVMENYNYTIYVPPTSEIQKLYNANLLPDWRDIMALEDDLENVQSDSEAEVLEAQIDSLNTLLENFIRYHIQNNAIYMNTGSSSSGSYESNYRGSSRFSTLTVTSDGAEGISIVCNDSERSAIEGEDTRHVTKGNYFAREFRFRSGESSSDATTSIPTCTSIDMATRIFNSSFAVVHLIDKPLLYTKELSDSYNEIP